MSHSRVKLPSCANCAYVFPADQPDDYCPRCGQLNQEINLSFGHVVEETLEGLFHFDSKVFQTLKLLLFYPGRLTQLYNTGHRVGYVPPIRLYVFISFVFFLLLSLLGSPNSKKGQEKFFADPTTVSNQDRKNVEQADSLLKEMHVSGSIGGVRKVVGTHRDSINVMNMALSRRDLAWLAEHETPARVDSMLLANGHQPTWLGRFVLTRIPHLQNATRAELNHKLQKNISLVMFLLMPIFALLLKALYVRQGHYYLGHLILSIHFHSFVFLLSIAQLLLDKLELPFDDWIILTVLLLPAWYLYKALRRLYQQSRTKTSLKVLLMMLTYGVAMILVLLGAVLTSLLQM